MGRKEDLVAKVKLLQYDLDHIRNIGTCAHIDHGKTTLSDSLLAGAGLISEELAGKQLFMDYDEQEQARGITINAAAASMVHDFRGQPYLVNLIDTPGHVDFGGDVTRAMRALDGAILVVCAVEGVMPQTETVIRQALKEKVRPIMFINKVDRLINELKVTPEQMQQRFVKIITEVNNLIKQNAAPEYKEKWQLKVDDGSVLFGSAFHKWAISVPAMKRIGIKFGDIYDHCKNDDQKALCKKSPVHGVVLDSVIRHHPSPKVAQQYRIPTIWRGDPASKWAKTMLGVEKNGPLAFMVTKIIIDPHAGDVAVGRIYGGSMRRGDRVHVIGMPKPAAIQQVAIMVGADRVTIDELVAGNIAAVTGLHDAIAGSTVASDAEMDAFEKLQHYTEPVVTKAIEAKHTRDLPKLVDVLRSVSKADPSIVVEINQETGEHLMSGMGELHLEITEYRIVHDYAVEINSSPPIVVYRESVGGKGGPFEGKSPNRHNRFYFEVEPMPQAIVDAIRKGEINIDGRIKDAKALQKQLEGLGMDRDDAKGAKGFHQTNMLVDGTKGIQNLHETMELVLEAFHEAMNRGPLAGEKVMGVLLRITDAKLHEDSIHRGPAQTIPAVRNGIYGAMCQAGRILLEPKQMVFINVPENVMGDATREMQQRRSVIQDIKADGNVVEIISKAPVAELLGFASAIRSATAGRALWTTEGAGFEPLPREKLTETVAKIRTRKGLKPEPYDEAYYAG